MPIPIYEIIRIIENNSDIMRIIYKRKGHELGPCDRKESFLLDVMALYIS
jgi:hypothetical protein